MSELVKRMSAGLLLDQAALMKIVRSAQYRYKVYEIPKRTPGEVRVIAQPAREVKALQHWLLRNVLSQFKIHQCATAYRKGMSIAKNARPHLRGRFVLKLDFEDFFPSFVPDDLVQYLDKHRPDFSRDDIALLCRVLFWRSKTRGVRLSIGAPTSPALSNILMHDFDRAVHGAAKHVKARYTRYADDLTFSAPHSDALQEMEIAVQRICADMTSPRLRLNSEKTVRVSMADSRRVTGLVLTNDREISIGRERKRLLRAAVHRATLGRLSESELSSLKGWLAYVKAVEPNFLVRLRRRYGSDLLERLK